MGHYDKLARDIRELRREVRSGSQANQGAHTSIEDGAINSYDRDGNLRLRIGAQDDGTQAAKYVQGPPPPRPTEPVVSVDGPVVRVRWDGELLGGHIPEDFARIDVHFALASDDLDDQGAVKGNLATVAGNETVLAATQTGTYRVGLVAVSQSRARSEMSDTVEVDVTLVDLEGAINDVIDNSRGGKNHYTPTPPEGTDFDPDRDLWFDTSVDEEGFTHYTVHRWNQETGEWVSISDERMNAYAYLIPNFYEELDEVRESVDGKTTIRWSPNAPSPNTPGNTPGDTWFQYGDGRQKGHWRWDGNTWVKQDFDPVMIPQLDIGTGTFGSLDGVRIKAGTITADVLGIGDFTNYVRDINRESAREFMARMGEHGQYTRVNRPDLALGGSVAPWLWQQTTGTGFAARSLAEPLTVVPGEKILLSFQARRNGASTPIRLNLWVQDSQGNNVAWDLASAAATAPSSAPDGEWRTYTGTVTVPASGYRVVPQLKRNANGDTQGGWYVTSIVVRRMVGSTLIEPGAITTEHILAGAITAESAIISSIDLGVATVGYLHGSRVEAGTIDTPQLAFGAATGDVLAVDALNFKTARGMEIVGSTFRAGDSVEITEDFGIRQFGPDGALNVSLPADGSPAEFRGDLSARTLTATGRMSVQGPGAIAAGGVLELESGVVPPVAGPQLTNIWDRITMPPLETDETVLGLAWGQDHWWRAVVAGGAAGDNRVEKITPTGELVSSFPIDFYPLNGLTMIGDDLILLGIDETEGVQRDSKKRFVRVCGTDGTRKHQWQYTQYGTGTYQPGLGKNGQRLIIAQCWATGELTYRQYSPSTGDLYVTKDTGDNFRSDVAGFLYGTFDLGTDVRRAVVGKKKAGTGRQIVVLNSLTHQYEPEKSWFSGEFRSPVAIEWDGSHFFSMESDGNLTRYQPVEPGKFVGDDEDDWWGAVAWASTDGTQVTQVGPATRFRYLHRSIIRRQNGDVPEGVERARFYVAKKATEPEREDLHYVTYSDNPTTWSRVRSIADNWDTFALPVTSNSFVTDKPGEIRSAIGTFRVDGSGAGGWGPLTFHPDGTVDGLARIATGSGVSVPSIPANGGSQDVVVTFPAGRFTQPPAVSATASNGRVNVATPGTVTTSSATLRAWNFTSGAANLTTLAWVAVQEGD